MKHFLSFLLLLSFLSGYSQSQTEKGKLPMLIPPSPEVAELARLGQLEANLFTGASQVNIPLFELKTGPITVPVGLDYSNNGIKVTDIPSRVGLGWSFIGGGMVSRVVHDEVDGQYTTLPPPADFGIHNQALVDYLYYANHFGYDTEADIYYFNAPGISGKFYIDGSGVPHMEDEKNYIITKEGTGDNIDEFVITNTMGVKYYFGSERSERTKDININLTRPPTEIHQTAWFLTQIISPEGHHIDYNYAPIDIITNQGMVQSVTLEPHNNPEIVPMDCGFCHASGPFPSPGTNNIEYDTYYLTSITTSNGIAVTLFYEDRPDAGGDNRLTTINMTANGNTVKKYTFTYTDDSQSALNQKFYLSKIFQNPVTETSTNPILLNLFTYYPGMPSQYSKSQDYYGYYNGKTNANFAPRPLSYANWVNGSLLADREPSAVASAGALRKVTFATGGYNEYFYEAHTKSVTESVQQWNQFQHLGVSMTNEWTTTSKTFTPSQSATLSLIFTISQSPGAPSPGQSNYREINGSWRVAELEVWDLTTNTRKFYQREFSNIGAVTLPLVVVAEHSYEITTRINGMMPQGVVFFKYDPEWVNVTSNKIGCGIRVKRIESFDPINNQLHKKFYTYASSDDLTKSSGVGLFGAPNGTGGLTGGYCLDPDPVMQPWGYFLNECTQLITITSSSISPPASFNGSSIAYKSVIESDTENLSNGYTEREFHAVNTSNAPAVILNHAMTGESGSEGPNYNGKEKSSTVYKVLNGNFVKVAETENFWGMGYLHSMPNFAVRKNYVLPLALTNEQKIPGYDVGLYTYTSGWVRLDSTLTRLYDQSGANPTLQKILNTYHANYPAIVSKTTTLENDGRLKDTEFQYPFDKTDAVYVAMKAGNIIAPIIEEKQKYGQTLISTVNTTYKNWTQGYKNYKPEYDKLSLGTNTPEIRVEYLNYDPYGNVLSVRKAAGVPVSYIWRYSNSYPVAQCTNALATECFFESFEESSQATIGTAHTGIRYYTGAYTVNWTRPNARSYSISYWYRSGGVWKLKEAAYTTNSHTCSGGDAYDDIRISPIDADLTTYTYRPGVGITSSTDGKGLTSYYEYDDFQRLKNIRDQNNNILKNYTYNYGVIGNEEKSANFVKQCSNGIGSIVTYTVPEGKHTAPTIGEANALADADILANGQAYANANGTCNSPYVRMLLTNGTVNGSGHTYFDHIIQVFADSACTQSYTLTAAMTVYYKKITTTITNGQPTITETNQSTNILAGANSKSLGNLLINTCVNPQNQLVQTNQNIQAATDTTGTNNNQAQSTNTQQDGLTGTQQNINGGATTNGNAPPPGGGQNCAYSSYILRPGTGYNLQGNSGGSGGGPGGGGVIE